MKLWPFRKKKKPQPTPLIRSTIEVLRVGPNHFIVMDANEGDRHQIDVKERYLLHLLDGKHTLSDIQKAYASHFGNELTSRSLREFLNQLHHQGLLEGSKVATDETPIKAASAPVVPQPLSREDPGRWVNTAFDILVVLFGWALHPMWIPLYAAIILLGMIEFISDFSRYVSELETLFLIIPTWILVPLSLMQTVVFMNLPRELAIGTAVRRFGGRIRHFGFHLLGGLVPFFGCDLGDSLQRMTPRGRNTVLAAGLTMHALIGAVCAIGWAMAPPGTGLATFFQLLFLPWVVGTFLHLNPLVQLEGYKILCAAVDQPRLQEVARAETKAWLQFRVSPQALSSRERFWLRFYGLSWHVWMWCLRLVYIVGGTWWAVTRLEGLGALIAVIVVIAWYRKLVGRLLMSTKSFQWMFRHGGNWIVRWGIRFALLGVLVFVAFLPYDREVSGKCTLVASAQHGVRAQLRDEIIDIHVKQGQWVTKGDLIATLSGRDIDSNYAQRVAELHEADAELALLVSGPLNEDVRIARDQVEIAQGRYEYQDAELERREELLKQGVATVADVEKSRTEQRTALNMLESAKQGLSRTEVGPRSEEIDAAKARVESARVRLAQAKRQIDLLKLEAPISGRVTTPNLNARRGQVAEVGDLIAVIVDSSELHLEIAADETAAPLVKPGMDVMARLGGLDGGMITAIVSNVSSTASNADEFRVDAVRTDREVLFERSLENANDSFHFRVYADLKDPEEHGDKLLPGMTCYARIVVGEDVFWRAMTRPFVRYFLTDVWSWLP